MTEEKTQQTSGASCGLEFDITFILFLLKAVFEPVLGSTSLEW